MENGSIAAVIRQIIEMQGDAIFLEPKRFCAFLDDLAIDARRECKIIRRGADEVVLRMFREVYIGPRSERGLKLRRIETHLEEELGISEEWRRCIMESFSTAFAWHYTATGPDRLRPGTRAAAKAAAPDRHDHDDAVVMGFRNLKAGDKASASVAFRRVLEQDRTCAEASLGMILASPEQERPGYVRNFRRYAPKKMSDLERRVYLNGNRDGIMKVYLEIGDTERIRTALDMGDLVTDSFFCETVTRYPDRRVVRAFLDHGFDKNTRKQVKYSDGVGEVPILAWLMEQKADPKVVEAMLAGGFDPNADRIFHSQAGHVNLYSLLDDSMWRTKNLDYMELLLQYGADVHHIRRERYASNNYEEKSILHIAVLQDNIEMVKLVLGYGADPNTRRLHRSKSGDSYYSPLYDCVWKTKNTEIAELLLARGAHVDAFATVHQDGGIYEEKSPLASAVLHDEIDMVSLLLKYGADPNIPRLYRTRCGDEYCSMLGDCIWRTQNSRVAELLLAKGADVGYVAKTHYDNGTYEEKNMLSCAVLKDNIDMVRLFLKYGADPNIRRLYRDKHGDSYYSPLCDCVWKTKSTAMAQLLIAGKASVDGISQIFHNNGTYSERTPLASAVLYNEIDMVRLLLKHGADPNRPRLHRTRCGDEYCSMLGDCIWTTENSRIATLLLLHGADVGFVAKTHYDDGTYEEKNMLSCAVLKGNTEMIRLFLKHGADPNSVRLYRLGKRQEHICALGDSIARLKNADVVRMLLSNGGNASLFDTRTFADGHVEKTCMLHYAVESARSSEILEMLVSYGASLDGPVPCKGKTVRFGRYPYKCDPSLEAALKKIGWKKPGLFDRR